MSSAIVPVLLVKNEENWIKHILLALANVFPHVIVADTGSTDSTVSEALSVERVVVESFGELSPKDLGLCRQWMQDKAKMDYGAEWMFLVDGDELYPTKYLQWIVDHPMPVGSLSGFTWGIECVEIPNGEIWTYDVGCNRQALISVDSKWSGVYPFESPDSYKPGDPSNFYWPSPDPTYHFFHVHQTVRSSHDEQVYMRMQKRHQLGMADHPEIKPHKFWLSHKGAYRDE